MVLDMLGGQITASDYVKTFPTKTGAEISTYEILRVFERENRETFGASLWLKRVDEVKLVFESKSDNELAKSLSVSSAMISDERNGIGGLSTVAKFKILDLFGCELARDGLLNLLPPRFAKKIRKFDDLRFVSRGQKRMWGNSVNRSAGECLEN